MKKIHFLDTTLRDGEQSVGCAMNLVEKLRIAKQLELLKVDVIEAGFAVASKDDFNGVKRIAEAVDGAVVQCLARATTFDIDTAWQALKGAKAPRIHTFIATSDIHMQHKLRMSPEAVIERTGAMVRHARGYCSQVAFSCEDATRTRPEFLARVVLAAINAGATVINIPDTVGYTTPEVFYDLLVDLRRRVDWPKEVTLSVHCHNDLGLAVANSLAGIRAGATQVECTVNGIGERAGNAALEELAMALTTRSDYFRCSHTIDTTQIYPTSRLVSHVTGSRVARNKAIVGENAFAHASGIHQHGMMASAETYEIMSPEAIGMQRQRLVLTKHSGRHAVKERLIELGHVGESLEDGAFEVIFEAFKRLADQKKLVDDRDLDALVADQLHRKVNGLVSYVVTTGSEITATATVRVQTEKGQIVEGVAVGHGPVNAAFRAIDSVIDHQCDLYDYEIAAITEGRDAQGEARVTLVHEGVTYFGRGLSTDILEASLLAYLDGLNQVKVVCERE